MKILIFCLLLTAITSCGKASLNLLDGDDSTLSGTVSKIWSNIGISEAYAGPQQDYSEEFLSKDIIGSTGRLGYTDILDDALIYANDVAVELEDLISATDVAGLTNADFPHGVVIAIGFDQNKKMISLLVSALTEEGSYTFNDLNHKRVAFYKMSFLFEKNGDVQYRQSYVFTKGSTKKMDVNYITSAASIKITEDLAGNLATDLTTMENNLTAYKAAVEKSLVSTDEARVADFFLQSAYDSYSGLNIINSTIINSVMIHHMRADALLKQTMFSNEQVFRDFLMISRNTKLTDFTGSLASSGDAQDIADAAVLNAGIGAVVADLIASGLIPSSGGGLGGQVGR